MCILIQDEITINVGALGDIFFKKGNYLYIGSAMGHSGSSTLINRVKRHVSLSSSKKVHWHIDYLIENTYSVIARVFLIPSNQRLECLIFQELSNLSDGIVKNFGSSDCKCKSHLLFFKEVMPL